jgi:hypothetical protein
VLEHELREQAVPLIVQELEAQCHSAINRRLEGHSQICGAWRPTTATA